MSDHLEQYYKTKRIDKAPEDELPECPYELVYLWNAFLDLDRGRPYTTAMISTPSGPVPSPVPLPIPFREIAAWSALYGVEFDPWEVDILRELDQLRIGSDGSRVRRTRAGDPVGTG